MSTSQAKCAGSSIPIGRRTALLGASAAIGMLLPLVGAHGEDAVRLADLVTIEGRATERAKALAGAVVTLRGYLDDALLPGTTDRTLNESPIVPCQLCGLVHGSDRSLPIVATLPADAISTRDLVEVTGRLEIARDAVRLVAAGVLKI